MKTWEFTLILRGTGEFTEEEENKIFEVAPDSTIGSVNGVRFADFDRDAPTFAAALTSAIRAFAGIGMPVVRVEPDNLVTAAEIAERADKSREAVRLWVAGERGSGDFPAPAARASARNPLWRWLEVYGWLTDRKMMEEADGDELESALFIDWFNAVLDTERVADEGLLATSPAVTAWAEYVRNAKVHELPPGRGKVLDLMAALEESLERSESKKSTKS